MRCSVATFLVFILAAVVTEMRGQTNYTKNGDGIGTLQSWYNSSTGLYTSPAGWWNDANAITTLANYERAAGNNGYASVFTNVFVNGQKGPGGHANFENNYYDDTGWWTLAWLDVYDLTGNSTYLTQAETMFSYMTNGWTTGECGGGGMIWNTTSTYQNAVTNELFLTIAAKLANRTSGSTSTGYLTWANKEWNWFKTSGMINSNNLINDGLKTPPTCGNNDGTVWTYNQGVILGGLVELARATNDPTLLTQAETIANAVLNPANGLVNSSGILVESAIGGSDNVQFKGIFIRNLMDLYKATNHYTAFQSFINTNANSIWLNDQSSSGYDFGAYWQGPFDSGDAVRQTSAEDALVAALAVQGRNATGPIETSGFGSMEMFAIDSGGKVWHNWQNRGNGDLIAPTNWSGWNSFSMGNVAATGGPGVAINSIYEQSVFIPTSGPVYVSSESNADGGWSSWTSMGSASNGLTGLIAHNSEANSGLYVFGRDSSGNIWYVNRPNPNTAWSSFTELGGKTVQTGFTIGENAKTGYMEVFGVDSGGTVWTNTQTGLATWSGWSSLPGETLQGYLTSCQNMTGHLQIFGIDTSSTSVWTNWQSADGGSWQTSWQNHGNVGSGVTIKPGFVCGQNANGNLQVFGAGNDGNVYSIWQNGSWTTSWAKIGSSSGQPLNPYLIVNSSSDGRITVLGVSTTSPYNVYGNWQSSPNSYSTWNTWSSWSGGGSKFYTGQP